MTSDSNDIRAQAEKRIRGRRQFWSTTATLVVVFLILVVVWGLTSGWNSYFWPMWPAFGFAIAIIFNALSVFGPLGKPVSQGDIDAEVRRLGGDGTPQA